jgi:hypothetical protein
MRRVLLIILCFTIPDTFALSASHPRHETILGGVVAYSGALSCLNGNSYWSMVIRVQRPKGTRSEFLRVDFSLPCDKAPEWVSAKPSNQKFRLFRHRDCDAVLAEFTDANSKADLVMPIWKYPPGAEHGTLPFGQIVPCYRSIDLHLAPAV